MKKLNLKKFKIDTSNKVTNLVVSGICLVFTLVITIISAVQFVSFKNYQAEFVLREGVVDEVIKFHEYSKYLKGTTADSDFYVINGTENTVALVKSDKTEQYAETIPATAKLCAPSTSTVQIDAASETLKRGDIVTVPDAKAAVQGIKDGMYDVAVMRHADAKQAVKESGGALSIAKTTLENVPSMLVLGGTHPNEPAGQLAATVILENAVVERGILYVVTETNKSAYSHSQPQEASPWYYSFDVGGTERVFKYGSRASNTVDQWPSPDVYAHSSGQKLSASEVRNINRAYPGSETGTFTEKIAWAITNFVLTNNVTIVIDLHEASPEYAVNNAMVYHQDSSVIKQYCDTNDNCFADFYDNLKIEESAPSLHGLTHRELGDFTGAYVFLFETSNASQGKFHGKFTEDLILYEDYKDIFYEYTAEKDANRAKEDRVLAFRPVAMRERVARHTESVMSIVMGYNDYGYSRSSYTYSHMPEKDRPESIYLGDMTIKNIPEYGNLMEKGVQGYLLPSER